MNIPKTTIVIVGNPVSGAQENLTDGVRFDQLMTELNNKKYFRDQHFSIYNAEVWATIQIDDDQENEYDLLGNMLYDGGYTVYLLARREKNVF